MNNFFQFSIYRYVVMLNPNAEIVACKTLKRETKIVISNVFYICKNSAVILRHSLTKIDHLRESKVIIYLQIIITIAK